MNEFTDIILRSELFKALKEDYDTATDKIRSLERTINSFREEVYCSGFLSVAQMVRTIKTLRENQDEQETNQS